MNTEEIKTLLERMEEQLEKTEFNQRVILACCLLPKDGPNWNFYENLFRHAERFIQIQKGGKHISEIVEDIILADPEDREIHRKRRPKTWVPVD